MSNYGNNDQPFKTQPELRQAMSGSWVLVGKLLKNPVKLIFDNQGTVDIAVSVNDGGSTTWRTFPGGEALILDCDLGTFPAGTAFYANGASGNFSISYVYIGQ